MGANSGMQILALGDRGAPVADVQTALRSLGLLPDLDGTAAPRPPQAMATLPDVALDSAVFDAATELLRRPSELCGSGSSCAPVHLSPLVPSPDGRLISTYLARLSLPLDAPTNR